MRRVWERLTGARRWGAVATLAGATILLAALLAVIVFVPQLAIDPSSLTRDQWLTHVQDLRTTILQGLGGLALLGTLYFSARTLRLNRRGQLTERFTKAIEQLGQLEPEKMSVRLGGIYALEQIALDSEELYWPVMEVLTAFLRYPSDDEATPVARPWLAEPPRWERDQTPARGDVQAIAMVLGRRPEAHRRWEREQRQTLQLRFADLARVNLIRAHLEGARLTGANLKNANLRDAHLEQAWLRIANLCNAHLRGARLDGAVLVNAQLERAFLAEAHLEGADLTGARLIGANLDGAHLQAAVLIGANLAETNLTRAQVEVAHVDASTILPDHLRDILAPANPDPR